MWGLKLRFVLQNVGLLARSHSCDRSVTVFFHGLPQPWTKCWVSTRIHFQMHASHVAFFSIKFKIFAKNSTFTTQTKFRHNAASQTQNSAPMRNFFPAGAHSQKPTCTTLPSSLSKLLLCFQPLFTKRTSGHFLGTFRAVKCLYPVTVTNVMRLNTSPILLFILLLPLFLLLRASSLKALIHPVHSSTRAHTRDGRKNALRHAPATPSEIFFLPFLIYTAFKFNLRTTKNQFPKKCFPLYNKTVHKKSRKQVILNNG